MTETGRDRLIHGTFGVSYALVFPGQEAWLRLASLPELTLLPAPYAPLRAGPLDAVARLGFGGEEIDAFLAAKIARQRADT